MDILKIPPQVIPYMPIIPGLLGGALNRKAGKYYTTPMNGLEISSSAVTDKLTAVPFLVLQEETFDRVGMHCLTAAAGLVRGGIYSDNNLEPASLIADFGAFDVSTTGSKEIVISLTLSPGVYWLAFVSNCAAVARTVSPCNILSIGSAKTSLSFVIAATFSYAELPATFPAYFFNDTLPICLALRRA